MDHKFNHDLVNALPFCKRYPPHFALVKFGGGIIQMSGSIAGTTFARNRSGNYARARTTPVNPNTALQVEVRAAMAFLTNRWSQDLTAANRTAWNLYASNVVMTNRLGESINLSGFNHYIRSNMILKQLGVGLVDPGPVIFEIPASDPTMSFTASEATQSLTVVYDDGMDWDNETGGYIVTFQGQPQNAQRNFFAGPWRQHAAILGADGAPVASPLISDSEFGISEGQRLWIYARILRADGRISQKFSADTFCLA